MYLGAILESLYAASMYWDSIQKPKLRFLQVPMIRPYREFIGIRQKMVFVVSGSMQ